MFEQIYIYDDALDYEHHNYQVLYLSNYSSKIFKITQLKVIKKKHKNYYDL